MKSSSKKGHSLVAVIKKQAYVNSLNVRITRAFSGSRKKFVNKNPNNFVASFDNKTKRSNNDSLNESITVRKINYFSEKTYEALPVIPIGVPQEYVANDYMGGELRKSTTMRKSNLYEKIINAKEKTASQETSPRGNLAQTFTLLRVQLVQNQRPIKPPVKVGLKEALKNSEWAEKAKPEIEKMWRSIINKSNGIEVLSNTYAYYKYFIGKGNNSKLIRKQLSQRSWWVEVNDLDQANFIWTQWKDKRIFSKFETGRCQEFQQLDTRPASYLCPVALRSNPNQYISVGIEDLGHHYIRSSASYTHLKTSSLSPTAVKIYNKLEFNECLSNKKGLFKSMKRYYGALSLDIFECVPKTFHVNNSKDPEFQKFISCFNETSQQAQSTRSRNIWILKPGENTNRGNGIIMCSSLDQIRSVVSEPSHTPAEKKRTYIIQKYIENPMLINRRKFDIRCYGLLTSINGVLQGYFYTDGYLRTASFEYSLNEISNTFVHLTNDAIQKHSTDYGRFEDANKLSYRDFQRYLDSQCPEKKLNFSREILPKIKAIMKDSFQAVFLEIDSNRRLHCMEIFGYDFMLDCNGRPWLIEVNTNPCLELSSNYLSLIIPAMVENTFRLVLDPIFQPPLGKNNENFIENKFELIFHQETDGKLFLAKLIKQSKTHTEENPVMLSDSEETSSANEYPIQ